MASINVPPLTLRPAQQPGDFFLKDRQKLRFEPRVLFEPCIVAPGRMGQRQHKRTVRLSTFLKVGLPCSNGLRQRALARLTQMVSLCILPDNQDQFDLRHRCKHAIVPDFSAFRARWQIPSLGIQARETEPHRYDCQQVRVIKDIFPNPHPGSQTISGRVCKGSSALVHTGPRCLAANANPRRRRCLENRSRLMRQGRLFRLLDTNPARAHCVRNSFNFFDFCQFNQCLNFCDPVNPLLTTILGTILRNGESKQGNKHN